MGSFKFTPLILLLLVFFISCSEDEAPKEGCLCKSSPNFDPLAEIDDGSCRGCTTAGSDNYNSCADINDGSCFKTILGCTDPNALNYDPQANTNNGTCIQKIEGCTNPDSFNYNPNANTDDGSCIEIIYGCMDPTASNYNPNANTDDGTCNYQTASITVLTTDGNSTQTHSILVESSIEITGNWDIDERGIVWSVNSNPAYENEEYATNGSGSGEFVGHLIGLKPNTGYYIRSYAKQGSSIYYGNEILVYTSNLEGFNYVAKEGETYTFDTPVDLAYGANGKYNFKYSQSGEITFNNSTFGDSNPGIVKDGYARDFTFIGSENSSQFFDVPVIAAYGANGVYTYEYLSGEISFSNSTFGDPLPGVQKYGFVNYFTQITQENNVIYINGTVDVAYGLNGYYYFVYDASGTLKFDNTTFGDPYPGYQKYGYFVMKN